MKFKLTKKDGGRSKQNQIKHVVIINGAPTSGKDTFASMCGKYIKTLNVSTVDPIRKAVKDNFLWDGVTKDDKWRDFMSEIKAAWAKYNNGPTLYALSQITTKKKWNLAFMHIRETPEIVKMQNEVRMQGYSCTTLLIRNPRVTISAENSSDQCIEEFGNYDVVINNNGTLEELRNSAENFIEVLFNPVSK